MSTTEHPPTARRTWLAAILIGALAALTALAVGHLVAAVVAPAASPLLAVGSSLIDLAPQPLKAFAIATFGERDKEALLLGIAGLTLVAATGIAIVSVRRPAIGVLGILAFGLVGVGAALARPTATPIAALPAIVGAAAGILVLLGLRGVLLGAERDAWADPGRRRFLVGTAGAAALVLGSGGLAVLAGRARTPAVAGAALPVPMDPAAPVPAGAELAIPEVSPIFTPNADFYRVDTALQVPVVDPATWTLRIHGMVDREVTLTFDDLLDLPLVERDLTIACVSNEVGGPYVGTARWLGVPLATVLELAGVRDGADQIVSRSIDGMTIGTPTAVALDGRDALLAIGMNGEALPPAHGYPVRMVVPGLYGYVSATKWLVDIELTTFAAYDPYWVERGWAERAPVRTMSRIDTPRPLATVPAGPVVIGGVAWAPHLGIDGVEVRVDDGQWEPARLSTEISIDAWRQWTLAWDATPGRHTLQVRAIDGDGVIQTEERREPFPDGATGWHSVVMTVA